MLRTNRLLGSLLLSLALILPLATLGCAERRYHDYDHNDYHRWNHGEEVYYQQWVVETHRDAHRDYRHLNKDEQREYWNWRHNHDHDHDRDHDRDHDHH